MLVVEFCKDTSTVAKLQRDGFMECATTLLNFDLFQAPAPSSASEVLDESTSDGEEDAPPIG